MKIAIVVPCHIPLSEAWVAALRTEATKAKASVIIIDDSDGKLGDLPKEWDVVGYKKQELFLGDLYPEFARMFHKSSACRVLGHIMAYSRGYEVIIGLDSDCIVPLNFIRDHTQFLKKDWGSGWFNPVGYPWYTRGFPYSQRGWSIEANMGLWKNVLDLNGKDRKDDEPKEARIVGSTVPNGYFPFSGMNFALTREVLFGFLFLPNFKYGDNDFRRIDDVWGGYILQKLMQKLRMSSMVGFPIVYHDTIVVPEEDAAEEAAMYKYEDDFISVVDDVVSMMDDKTNTIGRLMQNFCVEFSNVMAAEFHESTFNELDPAFKWWYEVIKKYA